LGGTLGGALDGNLGGWLPARFELLQAIQQVGRHAAIGAHLHQLAE
jgi:hypothetical protein